MEAGWWRGRDGVRPACGRCTERGRRGARRCPPGPGSRWPLAAAGTAVSWGSLGDVGGERTHGRGSQVSSTHLRRDERMHPIECIEMCKRKKRIWERDSVIV